MALSGRKGLSVVAGLLMILVACGGGRNGGGEPSPPSSAPTVASVQASCSFDRLQVGCPPPTPVPHAPGQSRSTQVSLGAAIDHQDTVKRPLARDGVLFEAQGRFENGFVLATRPAPPPFDSNAVPHYVLWEPDGGTEKLLWNGVAGRQDFVVGVSGKWILVLRIGYELPFPGWELLARDGADGSFVELAHDDPRLRSRPNIPARLPFGLAPSVSISGSRVVWAQFAPHDDGTTGKEIYLFDLASGEKRTLESITNVTLEDVWSAAIAGDRVVWVSHGTEGADRIVLLNLADGSRRTFDVGGDLYSVNVAEDGSAIAWDDGLTAKYVLYLDSGERLQYLGDEGWGTYRDGLRMSWVPSTDRNGNPGYFDVASRRLHLLEMDDDPNTIVPIGQAMDGWFVWMERDVRDFDLTHATVYFRRLE